MSVLLEQPSSLVAYRPNKPTAMVVVADPRVRSTVTRHLWALGVRDVIEASSVAEARPRIGNPATSASPKSTCRMVPASPSSPRPAPRAGPTASPSRPPTTSAPCATPSPGGVKGYVVTGTRTNLGLPTRPGAAPIGAARPRACTVVPGCPEPPGWLPRAVRP